MNLLLLQVFQKVTSVWRAVCPYRTAAGSKEPVLVVPGTLPLQSIKKTQPNKTTCALKKKKKGFLLFHLVLTGVPCQFCEEVERNWSQDTDLTPWWGAVLISEGTADALSPPSSFIRCLDSTARCKLQCQGGQPDKKSGFRPSEFVF